MKWKRNLRVGRSFRYPICMYNLRCMTSKKKKKHNLECKFLAFQMRVQIFQIMSRKVFFLRSDHIHYTFILVYLYGTRVTETLGINIVRGFHKHVPIRYVWKCKCIQHISKYSITCSGYDSRPVRFSNLKPYT